MVRVERLCGVASAVDFQRLAELHLESITDGFLTSLGDRFLRAMYAAIAKSAYADLLVAREEGRIVGFICSSSSLSRVYRDFVISAGPGVWLVMATRVLRFSTFRRIVETAFYPVSRGADHAGDVEVLNFCVDVDQRGRGVGQQLFSALVASLSVRGAQTLKIVTGASQDSAQRFYQSAGATLVGETEVHQGEPSLVFAYPLQASSQQLAA